MQDHQWISAFLEAAAAEQGAATNTQLAYGRDLRDFADWLAGKGKGFDGARREDDLADTARAQRGGRTITRGSLLTFCLLLGMW